MDTNNDTICDAVYLNSSSLQYKPDICAPGHHTSTYNHNKQNGSGGTSAATPVVSGICAQMMGMNTALKSNPMLMKSILLSSAERISNMDHQLTGANSNIPALSHSYGSGMVNAYNAYHVLLYDRYDSYASTDWTNQSTQSISIPFYAGDLSNNRRIYASICWEEKVDKNDPNSYTNNAYTTYGSKKYYIELLDEDNDVVSRSIYSYDRKQVIGYQPTVVGTYTLRITKYGTGTTYTHLSASYNKI